MVKIGILILSFSLLFSTLIQVLSAFFQKIFQANKIVLGELIGRVILLGLILIFIKFQLGFYFILGAFIASSGINFIILWRASRGLIDLRFKFDWTLGKKIFSQTWPIGLGIILNTIYFKADTIILSLYRPAMEVGIYGACYRVFEILITFPPLFLGLVFAHITQAWLTKNVERYKNLLQKSFDFLTMFSLPLIFGTLALGPKVMTLIGGERFLASGEALKVIILATGVLFVAELFKQVIVSLDLQRKALRFYLITAIFSVIGYFIFIPRYSYWGAAWMTVAGECLMFAFLLWMVWRESKFLPNLKFLWKSLVASLMMLIFLSIFASINLFFLIILGAMIYALCLWSLGGMNYTTVRSLFKRP